MDSKLNIPPQNASDWSGRFVVIHGMPRTASTSFRVLLNEQKDIICHGEILGPNNVLGTSDKQKIKFGVTKRNNQPYKFLESYFLDHSTKWLGFKGLSEHFLDRRNLTFLRWVFDTKPKVIILYRNDLVARYRSTLLHRLQAGHLKEEQILRLRPLGFVKNCIQTQEQWQMTNDYWMKDLDCVYINIKEIGSGTKAKIENLLDTTIAGELGRSNSKPSKLAATEFSEAIAHLDEISRSDTLDKFRDVKFHLN